MAPGQLLLDPQRGQSCPSGPAAARRRSARRSPRRTAAITLGSTYTAASPADTRVSRRSKATTGSSNAMYSIGLVHGGDVVQRVLRVRGQPDVGGGQDPRRPSSSGTRPVNSTCSARPSSSRSATRSSKQSPEPISVNAMSVRPSSCTTMSAARSTIVDAVLRAHHADVGGQEAAPAAQLRVGRAAPQPVRVRAGAHHRHAPVLNPAAAHRDVPVRARWSRSRGPRCGTSAARARAAPGRAAGGRRGTGTRTARGTGRGGRRRTGPVPGAQRQRDRPEDVRRVAGLHHVEPAAGPPGLERQPGGGQERVDVLEDEAGLLPPGAYGRYL